MTHEAPRTSVAQLNAMDRAAFVAALGELFEHSPWVADGAWPARPFADAAALHAAMVAIVRHAPKARQISFLNLHPELAGREAQAGTMTAHSTHEQHGAGLDALSRAELDELRRLNAAYRARHGFPFIVKVLGHTKAGIFDALRTRLAHDTPAEIEAALEQVARITRSRLDALLGAARRPAGPDLLPTTKEPPP